MSVATTFHSIYVCDNENNDQTKQLKVIQIACLFTRLDQIAVSIIVE